MAGGSCCELKLEDIFAIESRYFWQGSHQPAQYRHIPQLGPFTTEAACYLFPW